MFDLNNTSGFTQADCDLINAAVAALVASGVDESNAADVVTNNWREGGNTVESLSERY